MKAIIVYSGKGGVGKTTTTANIARLLSQKGHKVFIIDADINTPSMNTLPEKVYSFSKQSPASVLEYHYPNIRKQIRGKACMSS